MPVAVQDPHDGPVHGKSDGGDDEHGPFRDRFGVAQAFPGFPEDPGGDAHQGKRVYKRGQHTGAVIAVGFDGVGRFGLDVKGDCRQDQGQSVGEIVAGIGEESQTVGPQAGDDLDHDEQKRNDERPLQGLPGAVMVMMGVHARPLLSGYSPMASFSRGRWAHGR